MNRNVESRFSELPAANIRRSTFDMSGSVKTSFNAGLLIPFFCEEVLPGDTFDVTTSSVIRSHTLLTPIMDDMYLDRYYFFVPNRLVWEHWPEFCGENTSGPWAVTKEYRMPCISAPSGGFDIGTLADYFGLPVKKNFNATSELSPSSLPFRAYALICNEFFRDENVTDPLHIPLGDADTIGSNGSDYINDVAKGGKPFRVAKYHDYFTSALPAPQKGAAVGVPVSVSVAIPKLPVKTGAVYDVNAAPVKFRYSDQLLSSGELAVSSDNGGLFVKGSSQPGFDRILPANLWTDSVTTSPDNVNIPVNDLRLAFALQRYLETLARSGSRYTEVLLGLFGVRSPDARLQRPEYLGGNRVHIDVTQVDNTAQTSVDFLGDVGAQSQTGDVHHDFIKSFTEHGYVIGVCAVRYDHSYSQGFRRMWMRKKFTDFYNPQFANLGEFPVYKAELFCEDNSANLTKSKIFGYQEAWAEYRYRPNMVTGEMRPGVDNTLAHWNLSDQYLTAPTLSDAWIREDLSNVDRCLTVSSSVSHQFWMDTFISVKATRPMPMYSIPGLDGHL